MNQSYKGKLLISTPDISGDIFSRAVVFITSHDESGAFGFILNKKDPIKTEEIRHKINQNLEVYTGGPVEPNEFFYMFKGSLTDTKTIDSDEYIVTNNSSLVTELLKKDIFEHQPFKVFAGYSGWGAHQLDAEINNKLWTVVDHYKIDLSGKIHEELWKNIKQNLGGRHLIWANTPEDPRLN
ncbi:YqgE/AlgH family protein [Riemerella columbina]|uniref:YqgE/AlgH family protein n=1 Tax=Riemerella columbina TaxID=103810 RepID=UPI000363DD28|nr:YqgE/AlgH family protein [Riemerella columbina]